jgi:magnesium chelatase family protein
VVVNLSPAGIRKDGPGLDLPIALGVLAASAQIPGDPLRSVAFAGELSLRGELVPTAGILAVAVAAARAGIRSVVVPQANHAEAALVEGLEVVAAPSLQTVVEFLRGRWKPPVAPPEPALDREESIPSVDFAEVRGQDFARRAMEIAAAGGHNALLVGPPGAGKTMVARRLATILPPMTRSEALEVTRLHSVAGLLTGGLVAHRPFRAPHHSTSAAGLLGGGTGFVRPGEVSLAHHGVLFLDEVSEFRRDALEGLRQPTEEGRVVVARAAGAVQFPARFTLIAASNPCPCGFEGDPRRSCRCQPVRAEAYRARLSGPLVDRIDLHLAVPRLSRAELLSAVPGESSASMRGRVESARARQRARLSGSPWTCNAQVPGRSLRERGQLTAEAEEAIASAVDRFALTGRGFDRTLRVARTIADLEERSAVEPNHVREALAFRAQTFGAVARAG